MQWEMKQRPDFAICKVTFDRPGEQVIVEASSMVAKNKAMIMKTNMGGGIGGALKRKISGETVFQNTFTASNAGETLWFAPPGDGDMECFIMDGAQKVYLSSSAFVGSDPAITLNTKFQGVKGFFSGTKLFIIECEGTGPLWFAGYGAIHTVDVGSPGYEEYIVDTGHIVGWTGNVEYTLERLGGIKTFFTGGEGIVCRFRGQGRVWVGTRSSSSLAMFLQPFRPKSG